MILQSQTVILNAESKFGQGTLSSPVATFITAFMLLALSLRRIFHAVRYVKPLTNRLSRCSLFCSKALFNLLRAALREESKHVASMIKVTLSVSLSGITSAVNRLVYTKERSSAAQP